MRTSSSGFEWRATFGSLRWLILGSLGLGGACGGRTEAPGEAADIRLESAADTCVFEASLEGGMERCQNGLLHRVASSSCSTALPRDASLELGLAGTTASPCEADAECTNGPYGRCLTSAGGRYCVYGCVVDEDCSTDQLCLCDEPVGRCVPAACRSDAECGSGSLCASNEYCGTLSFSCTQPADSCTVSSDCVGSQVCSYVTRTPWVPRDGVPRACGEHYCPVPGRPFLVHGAERMAPPVQRADWYGGESAGAPAVTPELARAIAAGWTEQALMEHASVAAFARFAMQLLSLGAPAQLLEDTARAMQDEIRHARDCFRLARRHLPADIGPGALPIAGALEQTSLREIVLTTVREGCIGESVAALEASEALAHCTDADARAVLERIAVEEGEHAQLAWRFVAWALESAPLAERAEFRASVEQAFRAELGLRTEPQPLSELDHSLARFGLLSAGIRQALRERVLTEVIAPCAEALLAATSAPLITHFSGASTPSSGLATAALG